jgi:hypothetical protein
MLVRITDDLTHAGQSCQFFRSALSVASGDNDPAARIFPMDAPDGRPRVLVGRSGHSAGIQNDNSCHRRRARSFQSQLSELTFDSGSVGLGSPAAKVLYVEAFHAPNTN